MLPEIEHVVVLMMENHSYDSYFGALRRGDGFRFAPDGQPRNANPDGTGNLVRAFHMPSTCQLHALPGQDWNRSHTVVEQRPQRRLRARRRPRSSMGYWDQTDIPVLLRAREHVPARRPLVRLGARADVPEPPVPHGRHRVGQRQHVGRVAHRATAAERDDLRPVPGARHHVAELLHATCRRPRSSSRRCTDYPTNVVADQPVLHRRGRGHAAVLQPRRPELRHRVGGEPAGHPARRAVRGEGDQRGDALAELGEDRADLDLRRARWLLRPRAAAARGPARRHPARHRRAARPARHVRPARRSGSRR